MIRSVIILSFGFLLGANNSLFAQDKDSVYAFVDEEPVYPGGELAMMEFIQTNVIYPDEAILNGEQGTVYVEFVVGRTGSVSKVKIIRGASENLDAEAVRVIGLMPNWKPGKIEGEAVACRFTLPINFKVDKGMTKKAQKEAKKKK